MRLRRLPWGRILLIAALLAPVGWAAWRALSPPPDLYSRYERYVLWEIDNSRPGFFRRLLKLPPRVPSFDLVSWEDEYGDDPRYWQLRMQLESAESEYIAAIDRGVFDAASFDLLAPSMIEKSGGEQKVLSYYEKAIACDQDNAWYYYRKADYLLSLGEIEAAREWLRAGNSAEKFHTPLAFPASEANARLGKARGSGQKAAVGYILSGAVISFPNYTLMKAACQNASVAFALGYPLEFGDELLTRARRMGQAGEDRLQTTPIVAAVLVKLVLGYAHDELLELTPQQEAEYQAIHAQLEGVKQVAKDASEEARKRLKLPKTATGQQQLPTRGYFIELYEIEAFHQHYLDRYAAHYDCLDPPPLTVWASGRLRSDVVDSKVAE